MIAIFDEDGGGDVDFQEFVTGLSAFSSKGNKEEKLRFAFKVYDIDRDGYISNGELFIVLKMMVGSNLKDQQLQQVRWALSLIEGLRIFVWSPTACNKEEQAERILKGRLTNRFLTCRLSTRRLWKRTRTETARSVSRSSRRWWRIRMFR